ncbi:MAG TPA: response regulator transcription factor [Thermoanaerobacterales bacterium]|nr:response regulator transcription factor [Thermoanaerobacterales bacterium]
MVWPEFGEVSALQENKKQIKVIIADDHALLREGIIKILSLEPDIAVVGEAEDGDQVIELARNTEVDIILMDINMPNVNGIKATQIIKAEKPEINIIALTIHDQEEYLFELIRSGISGYVLKDVRPQELVKTIRCVAEGQAFIPPSLTPKVFKELNRLSKKKEEESRHHFDLTEREMEVLQQISMGLSNREIAENLYITEKTVKNHLTNIFQKLGVNDRTQAVLFAIKHNLVET